MSEGVIVLHAVNVCCECCYKCVRVRCACIVCMRVWLCVRAHALYACACGGLCANTLCVRDCVCARACVRESESKGRLGKRVCVMCVCFM